ncbi:MAG: hypothetical protein D6736_00995 [Nitrospinota bacterium]|nr:MAG: hypothetical protein D6736_00995 [Nitrospinota bacterium]
MPLLIDDAVQSTEVPEEMTPPLTLMDLFTALCEETDDDRLVAAAVIDLFCRGYVKMQGE